MAFRRSRRRRMSSRRGRRSHNDIVPLSLCRDPLVVPSSMGTTYTCVSPFNWAIPLVDGGALGNILRVSASANVIPEDYRTSQGISRGLSFHGAQFDFVWAYADDPQHSFDDQANGFTIMFLTMAMGLVKIETVFDPVTNVRGPTRLPNLFSPDEQEAGDYLYRWHTRLPMWTMGNSATQPVDEAILTDSTGMLSSVFCYGETTTCYLTVGTGSHTQIRHRVKSKRFLDEDHAIYLCGSMVIPAILSDTITFGIDMLGYMAIKGR